MGLIVIGLMIGIAFLAFFAGAVYGVVKTVSVTKKISFWEAWYWISFDRKD